MKVLITEQERGTAADVAQRLGAAGHVLTYCHRPEVGSTPGAELCAALVQGGRCPLANGDIAVAVDARAHEGPLTAREFGVICALRTGTPLVVTGPLPDRHLWPWHEADVRCAPEEVVGACDRAMSPVGPAAHRAATEAAARVLRQFVTDERLTVTLRVQRGAVDALVTSDRPLTPRVREAIRAAVRAHLAAYTSLWQYVQVYFTP